MHATSKLKNTDRYLHDLDNSSCILYEFRNCCLTEEKKIIWEWDLRRFFFFANQSISPILIKMCEENRSYFVYLFIWICTIYIEICGMEMLNQSFRPNLRNPSSWSNTFGFSLNFDIIGKCKTKGDLSIEENISKICLNGEPLNTISCFVCCLAFFYGRRSQGQKEKKNAFGRMEKKNENVQTLSCGGDFCNIWDNIGWKADIDELKKHKFCAASAVTSD